LYRGIYKNNYQWKIFIVYFRVRDPKSPSTVSSLRSSYDLRDRVLKSVALEMGHLKRKTTSISVAGSARKRLQGTKLHPGR
jgi:hypothetical protein